MWFYLHLNLFYNYNALYDAVYPNKMTIFKKHLKYTQVKYAVNVSDQMF